MLQHLDFKKQFPGKHVEGYTQTVSMFLFNCVMFMEESLEAFHKLTESTAVTLFLDATGGICRNLRPFHDDKDLLYYGLVVKGPNQNQSPVPIAEMISSDQSGLSIQQLFSHFFKA